VIIISAIRKANKHTKFLYGPIYNRHLGQQKLNLIVFFNDMYKLLLN